MSEIDQQKQKIEKLLSRFKYPIKYPTVAGEIREILTRLYGKLEKPEDFAFESVSYAKHDIELLCLIEDGIEILIKAVNKF